MRAAATLILATLPSIASATCASESAVFSAALESRGYIFEAPGTLIESAEQCTLSDIRMTEANLAIEVAELAWSLNGLASLASRDGTVTLEATLSDLRISPRTQDRWVTYMLSEQNRRNTIDISLRSAWDTSDGQLDISSLDIDLPGDNRVGYSLQLTGATPDLLTGNPSAFQALALEQMDFQIENRGFADTLILGPLIASLSQVPGSPETVVEGTKRSFRALVSNLPNDVFPPDTKTALVSLINAGPVPWGALTIRVAPDTPIALAPFFDAAVTNLTPDGVSALFQGGTVDVTFIEDNPAP